MRTTDERMAELSLRAKELKRKKQLIKDRVIVIAASCVCVLMIFGLSCFLPWMTPENADIGATISGAASIFQNASFIKYIIIGVVSFILGCAVTLLCVLLHRRRQKDESDD